MYKVSVKDLVLFITGTSRRRGIGHALVTEAINRGAKKVYIAARDISSLNDLVVMFQDRVVPIELDVTNNEHIQNAAAMAHDTQILINNAGTGGLSGCVYNFDEMTARQELEVNYLGPLKIINIFSQNIIKNGNGAIVNVISLAGLHPSPMYIGYSASKAALYSLTQAVRIEMFPHSIPVFGIYPGPIDTDMTDGLEVKKEHPINVALRVFDAMEKGVLDITTDALSDNFESYLKKDPKAIEAVKREFGKNS